MSVQKTDLPNVGPLFHKLWTKAVGTENYVKAEWIELQRTLSELNMDRATKELALAELSPAAINILEDYGLPIKWILIDASKGWAGKPFEIAATQVTIEQWCMGSNCVVADDDDRMYPIVDVTWYDAVEWCARNNCRLPTEQEWEFACCAGRQVDKIGATDTTAWTSANSDWRTHPVGQKLPNTWGLFDMFGNVWEWCSDLWGSTGSSRVIRGGSRDTRAADCHDVYRYHYSPFERYSSIGFRPVRAAMEKPEVSVSTQAELADCREAVQNWIMVADARWSAEAELACTYPTGRLMGDDFVCWACNHVVSDVRSEHV